LKKIVSLFLIFLLISSSLFIGLIFIRSGIFPVKAETGAPPLNSTTGLTWQIEGGDSIYRSNEDLGTIDILVKASGYLEWTNITCTTIGNITVEDQGIFILNKSDLTLEGNLTINGSLTLKNTILKMNPSINGEYQIKIAGNNAEMIITDLDDDPLTTSDSSHITSAVPDGNHRYIFEVGPNTNFEFRNSKLSQCGYNNIKPGLTIRTNQYLIENSSIFNNYVGLNFIGSSFKNIITCDIYQNSYVGIKFANISTNNDIIDCKFTDNHNSIMLESSAGNKIKDCDFDNSGLADFYYYNASGNNVESCNSINSNHAIYITSSNDNIFNNFVANYTSADIVNIIWSDDNVFTNCKFTDSGLNGVSLTNSANNAFTLCNISENSGWGIGIDNNNGLGNLIQYSTIMNNIGEGVRIDSSASQNLITRSEIINNTIGIYFNSASLNMIKNCNITRNSNYGVHYFTGAQNSIQNSKLSDNPIGLYLTFKSRFNYINNSGIQNSTTTTIMIDGSSNLTTVDTHFDKGTVDIKDSSNLTIKWNLEVNVEDFETTTPIEYADVKIKDEQHSTYHMNFQTDSSGWTGNILITELFQTATSIFAYNPHRVRASKVGYDTEIQDVDIIKSMKLYFSLKKTVLPIRPDLMILNVTLSNHTPVQEQEIQINATIYNNGTDDFNVPDVPVRFYIDNITLIDTVNIPELLINGQINVQVNWIVNVTNGSHMISAIADMFNVTFELDEDNNKMEKPIIINTIGKALLSVNRTSVQSTDLIEFDASDSTDEVLGVVQYYFDYGNGNTSGWVNDSKIDYGYPASGVFYARVRVRDRAGLMSKWSNVILLNIGNRPPVAGFSWTPEVGYVSTIFKFEPSGSFDIDGILVKYEWDFGDGTSSDETAPSHSFPDDVSYIISLMVYDDKDVNSTLMKKSITIDNLRPNAKFSVNKDSVGIDEVIVFDATSTIDFDDDNLTELNYTWIFKDGGHDYGRFVFHSFSEEGIYNVTLMVTDDDEGISQFVVPINVLDKPTSSDSDGGDGDLEGWIMAGVGIIVLIIMLLIILFIFVLPSKRQQLTESSKFVTTGKVDFVILKKKNSRTYRKFELHLIATPASPTAQPQPSEQPSTSLEEKGGPASETGTSKPESDQKYVQAIPLDKGYQPPGQKTETGTVRETHMGLYWKTGLIDSNWVVYDTVKGDRNSVVTTLNKEINGLMQDNWNLDYAGSGIILQRSSGATQVSAETKAT
jgi:parallel beta-helix repeat protein